MDAFFEYRLYVVRRTGATFSAESADGERFKIRSTNRVRLTRASDDECLLISTDRCRLNSAIDNLWDSLERGVEPAWFSGSSAIDLDTFGPETAAFGTAPPVLKSRTVSVPVFLLSAAMVSAPLSY